MSPGCEAFENLRKKLHSDEGNDGKLGSAGLQVEVEPADGISILLDGVRVASASPYVDHKLKAGPHQIEVRAMGFYSMTLPVTLKDDKLVTIPVALRQRPVSDPETKPKPLPKPKAPIPEPPPSPILPPGIPHITLVLAPNPETRIALDRVTIANRQVTLERFNGEIVAGSMSLRYAVGSAGLLTLEVPNDRATWFKDGAKLDPGASFRINQGVVRLRRVSSGGDEQSLLIRR